MVQPQRTALICLISLLFSISITYSSSEEELSTSALGSPNLSINGTKFEDLNADGFQGLDEPGISGWIIFLRQNGTDLLNATTDEQGRFSFSDVPPGEYEVAEMADDGWMQTSPGGGSYTVTLTDKPACHIDFGSFRDKGISAVSADREHPVMRPTPEEARRWAEQYSAAPKAYLSPGIEMELAAAPGAAFSLLDYLEYTPSERNQGYCGNCWAWAGTGAIEIDNAFKNGEKDRLSVQYLNSNFEGGSGPDWACCGGWLGDVAAFYSNTGMAIPWSNANAHWQDGNRFCSIQSTSVSAGSISTNPRYAISSIQAVTVPTRGVGKDKAIANIKNVLQQGKAVWFGFFLPDDDAWGDFGTFWIRGSEEDVWQPDFACGESYNYNEGGGHAVLCVGYDDSDPDDSCWIMLNSWGRSSGRPHGLFRVSMDMNYDCSYANLGYAFYWMALNIAYPSAPNNAPAVPAVPSGPDTGNSRVSYSYSTSATDPDGDTVKYVFDWGDDESSETALVSSGESASASHIWSDAGNYAVKARAEDRKGLQSEWSSPKTVAIGSENRPPAAPSSPAGTASGYAFVVYAYFTSAVDPDDEPLSYTFDWGDGTTSELGDMDSGVGASASHAWGQAGTYLVKARAMDGSGETSAWSGTKKVKISANRPPAAPAVPSGPSSAFQGASSSYSTSASDPDKDKVKYSFDWGDGTTSDTSQVRSGTKASTTHVWNNPGIYHVKARTTDIRGSVSAWSDEIAVNIVVNQPPGSPGAPSGPATGRTRASCKFTASATDPDGDRVKYVFEWGDGTTSTTAFVASGASASASHSWKRAGTYYIKARAVDNMGLSSEESPSAIVTISTTGKSPRDKRIKLSPSAHGP